MLKLDHNMGCMGGAGVDNIYSVAPRLGTAWHFHH